jgi:hypothetical protein
MDDDRVEGDDGKRNDGKPAQKVVVFGSTRPSCFTMILFCRKSLVG